MAALEKLLWHEAGVADSRAPDMAEAAATLAAGTVAAGTESLA
jgi:hypothetical protein